MFVKLIIFIEIYNINFKFNYYCNDTVILHTGSTLSQLLNFPIKSTDMTWPQTEVILKFTVSDIS